MFETLAGWLDPRHVTSMVVEFVPRLVAALLVFFLFWFLVKATSKPLRAVLRRASFNAALIDLLVDNVYRISVLVLGGIMAASQLGINVAAALAGVGVAGIALGFAAQDSVANTISGFLIFWDKPFDVGHWVESQDHYGSVVAITMRTTRIRTPDNTYVIVPNKEIIQGSLVNHSMYGETRVNVPVGIAYKEDIPTAREVLLAAARRLELVLSEPAPEVVVSELAGSSVNLLLRVWVDDAAHERRVFFETLEAAKLALDAADIQIPYPHLQLFVEDVHAKVWNGAEKLRAS